jgi:hypothetical protein
LTSFDARSLRPQLAYAAPSIAGGSGSTRFPFSIKLLLAAALGLLLLVVAAALAPARALPVPVFIYLDGHRELVLSAVTALGLGTAAGLLVAFLS